jgi:hypothetical protein
MSDDTPVTLAALPFAASESLTALAPALAACQGEIEAATKDKVNPAFKSSYADLHAVRAVIREPLAKNGLSLVQLPAAGHGRVTVTSVLLHKSGEWIACELAMPLAQATPHAVGSAISYGRRYAAMAMLGVSAEDDDGTAAGTTPTGPPPVQQQAAQAATQAAKALTAEKAAAKPAQPTDEVWRNAQVKDVKRTQGTTSDGRAWTRYAVAFGDGRYASTFDTTIGTAAADVAGTGALCDATVRPGRSGKGHDLVRFEVLDSGDGPDAASADDDGDRIPF